MDELRKYLNETLGLKIEYGEWLPDANLPLFLSRSASYALDACSKASRS